MRWDQRSLGSHDLRGDGDAMTRAQIQDKTDHALKAMIQDELSWAPNVNADRIGVSVNDDAVILSGQVDTYPEKESAVRAALRVRGVSALADEIVVDHGAWGPREDVDIARDAAAALERNVSIPAKAIKATVHDQVLTLTGTVSWQHQREAAHRAVASLPGVARVINHVALKPMVTASAAKTKSKITSAIMRNAQLDANHIMVAVHGSEVALTGTVSSWAERRQADHAAWAAPGVTSVVNRLTVSSV